MRRHLQTSVRMLSLLNNSQLFQKSFFMNLLRAVQTSGISQKADLFSCAKLNGRSLVRVSGRDAKDLLQGLTTNDIELLTDEHRALYTMFLNNQGRILYDVICYWHDPGYCDKDCYILECDTETSKSLEKHLKMYRLRKKVDIALYDEAETWAMYNSKTTEVKPDLVDKKSIVVLDPRISGFASRLLLHQSENISELFTNCNIVDESDYRRRRYLWGVSEGVTDMPVGDSFPLESNLAFMNGVSFSKGCYLGQELTARTHYTGVIRKRLMPVDIASSTSILIDNGVSVKNEDGKNTGKLRSHIGNNGLALLRVSLSQNKKLIVNDKEGNDIEMTARIPEWWPNKENLLIQ
ncbi:putative transferase CAF17 homolog, mitochondrial [Antedon mediterranea]|uniref:putative transferase CAF17 homolog, mitochondrial n=1 Tax=Antedon mediterranea TaxID=105859 RepID=UPI003AF97C0A